MKKYIFVVFIIFSILLSGCANTGDTPNEKDIWDVEDEEADNLETIELTIQKIQEKANAERRANVKAMTNLNYDDSTMYEDANAISQDEASIIKKANSDIPGSVKNKKLTKDEATEDIQLFSDIIQSTYGSYYLYEKDLWTFANKKCIDQINNLSSDTIDVKSLANIFLDSYYFINDDHFRINGISVLEHNDAVKYYCYIDDMYFFEDGRGFFTYKNDKKWYLKSVGNDNNIKEYIKPTITKEGQLAYQIGSFLIRKADKSITVELQRGNVANTIDCKYTFSISLNQKKRLNGTQSGIYDGYYVLGIRSFMLSVDNNGVLHTDPLLDKYGETANLLSGTSNFIIDSRSNGGGGDLYLQNWYENYNKTQLQLNISEVRRHSRLNAYRPDERLGTTVNSWDGTYAENQNLFVYLIDKDVASAGERGILSMKQMDNVLIIGTNSRGCILGGGGPYVLPNSEIVVNVGDTAFIEGNCTSDIEGLGWLPDIYVDGYLALDRAIKMYKYYGLEPDENVYQIEQWGSVIPRFE